MKPQGREENSLQVTPLKPTGPTTVGTVPERSVVMRNLSSHILSVPRSNPMVYQVEVAVNLTAVS